MKTVVNSSVSILDLRRLLKEPGPTSKIIDSFTRRDGQARLALTAEPPDPRNVSFNAMLASVSFAVVFLLFAF